MLHLFKTVSYNRTFAFFNAKYGNSNEKILTRKLNGDKIKILFDKNTHSLYNIIKKEGA